MKLASIDAASEIFAAEVLLKDIDAALASEDWKQCVDAYDAIARKFHRIACSDSLIGEQSRATFLREADQVTETIQRIQLSVKRRSVINISRQRATTRRIDQVLVTARAEIRSGLQ